jgi:acyl dehydratase
VRARLTLQATEALAPDGLQMTWLVTVEREGADKPACVAESLSRSYGAPV